MRLGFDPIRSNRLTYRYDRPSDLDDNKVGWWAGNFFSKATDQMQPAAVLCADLVVRRLALRSGGWIVRTKFNSECTQQYLDTVHSNV